MEKGHEKSSIVMKYGKRRYDGGNEIELIRAIERQKAVKQLQMLQQEHLAEVQHELLSSPTETEPVAHDNPITAKPAESKALVQEPVVTQAFQQGKKRVLEAVLLGPMELCVGSVGILTASLAIITFKQLNNEPLLEQSRGVFSDCCKTLKKGLFDCLNTPIRVFKAIRHKS